jgi:hypothetical protein
MATVGLRLPYPARSDAHSREVLHLLLEPQ